MYILFRVDLTFYMVLRVSTIRHLESKLGDVKLTFRTRKGCHGHFSKLLSTLVSGLRTTRKLYSVRKTRVEMIGLNVVSMRFRHTTREVYSSTSSTHERLLTLYQLELNFFFCCCCNKGLLNHSTQSTL